MALQPETYLVKGCADFSSGQLSASSFSQLPSIHLFSPLSVCCGQSPQPCCTVQRCCSWVELSLCTRALLPGALSVPGARPSSTSEAQPKALK